MSEPDPPSAPAGKDAPRAASRLDAEISELRSLLEQRGVELEHLRRRLDERERELADRAREVLEAELRVQRAGWRVAHLAEELDRRADELAAREERLAGRLAAGLPDAPPAGPGRYDLATLERLVEASGQDEDREEWSFYLLYLRDYATPDGRLPKSVDWLVEEVFADVLEGAA